MDFRMDSYSPSSFRTTFAADYHGIKYIVGH